MKKISIIASSLLCTLALVVLITASEVVAQDKVARPWEIALDVLPLIKSEKNNLGLLIRKPSEKGSVRFKVSANGYSNPVYVNNLPDRNKFFELNTAIGYQWQKNLYDKFSAYYGADLGFSQAYSKLQSFNGNPASTYQVQKATILNITTSAFIGGNYHITPNISLSIETALVGAAGSAKSDINLYQVQNDVLLERTKGRWQDWSLSLKSYPIYVFYLGYSF